jgi:Flp pilus assembly protein TadG
MFTSRAQGARARRAPQCPRPTRRGVILPLTVLLLVFMLILVAFAIDIGYLVLARTELQRTADAAAMAAVAELVDDEALTGEPDLTDEIAQARNTAVQYAAANSVCSAAPAIDSNSSNSTSGDVVIGYLSDPSDPTQFIDVNRMDLANAVRVRVRRSANQNGEVGLFFARVFGLSSSSVEATATAAMMKSFVGFETPDDNTNLPILPITLQVDTWNDMMAGAGADKWGWIDSQGQLVRAGDNIREMNLYPETTASPGNVGTVDIGTGDNSSSDIKRQILQGISPQDMAAMPDGKLELNANGELSLNGDTGVSATMQSELWDIRGQARIIPLYRTVVSPGNNAQFTIVGFVGIRIMDVDLTGALKNKRLTIQPANIKTKGGIGDDDQTNSYIHSYVWLVR